MIETSPCESAEDVHEEYSVNYLRRIGAEVDEQGRAKWSPTQERGRWLRKRWMFDQDGNFTLGTENLPKTEDVISEK